MKEIIKQLSFKIQICTIFVICINQLQSQSKDTLVNIGKYELNFTIIKGVGTPILFESGSGNDGTIWQGITQTIADITGATVITYDRAGLGKSKIKSDEVIPSKNTILDNVKALEQGLKKIGYADDIVLVAHSLGGFYATLFTSRNRQKVKSVVFIDAALASFYTDEFVNKLNNTLPEAFLNKLKAEKLGLYYEIKNIEHTINTMHKTNFPTTITVTDLIASNPFNPFKNDKDKNRWIKDHERFVNASTNRQIVTVNNAGHYVFKDNPNFSIYQIIKTYVNTTKTLNTKGILLKVLHYSSEINNLKEK